MQKQDETTDHRKLKEDIRLWASELGFQQMGISDIDLSVAEERLAQWLRDKFHGTMDYMHQHGSKRSHPE